MRDGIKVNRNLSKTAEKKLKKQKSLIEAAYELFTTKGVNDTAISDIVKSAGVAKGTFYLYFKDKYDLIDLIVLRKSSNILKEALEEASKKNLQKLEDEVVFAVDYIIEKLKIDKKLLRLIYKDLSMGIYRKALKEPDKYEEMKIVQRRFIDKLIKQGVSSEEAEKILFVVLELTGGVIYTSIILEEPYTIEEIKPTLFETIRRIVRV